MQCYAPHTLFLYKTIIFIMSQVVTTAQLNAFLNGQIEACEKQFLWKGLNSFELLKITGIRADEINLKYWIKLSPDLYKLTPTKRNNERFFTEAELTQEWIEAIELQNPVRFTNSYSSLMYYFQKTKLWSKMYVNVKEICNHLYRHLYARNLKDLGYTDDEIRIKMGEKKQTSADEYIYGIIYID